MRRVLNLMSGIGLAMLMSVSVTLPAAGQSTDDNKSVKQDVKDAGHSTKEAAKTTGTDVKKGTKKVVHKSAEKTDEGAKKVEDKTAPKN
jgi:hypothetical protein